MGRPRAKEAVYNAQFRAIFSQKNPRVPARFRNRIFLSFPHPTRPVHGRPNRPANPLKFTGLAPNPTTPPKSRNSRAWRGCASAPTCTSATRTSAACTTASSRSWTTRSTRRWPGFATVDQGHDPPRRLLLGRGRRPRHPGRHPPGLQDPGPRARADEPPRGRKIRQGRLPGLRRPARRRREVRERGLGVVRGRGAARRARSTRCASRRERRRRR